MSIYGNIFKPVTPEYVNQLVEAAEAEVIQEATELGLYTEAKFHLFKVGDSKEYKDVNKDLKDAEQILNANGEDIDVNKIGNALLHGVDAIVTAINAGTSAAAIVQPAFLPVALVSKLVSVATKSGKEAEALKFADDALTKLEDIKAGTEDEAQVERINKIIDKLQKSKHTLEVGKKAVKKEEKAMKKEEKAVEKAEKKEDKENKKALKAAAKSVKKNKATDDNNEDDDEDAISQVESSSLMEDFVNFCSKEGIELTENMNTVVSNILEGGCNKGECDKEDDEVDENDRKEVNAKIAEELSEKKESAIYTAFRALMAEATDEQIDAFLNEITDQQRREFTRGMSEFRLKGKDAELYNKADKKDKKEHEKLRSKGLKTDSYEFSRAGNDLSDMPTSDWYNKNEDGTSRIPDLDKKVSYDKNRAKVADKILGKSEKAAYKENEKRESAAEKAKAKQEKREAKAATESVEDLFNFVVENDVEITEDLYNAFVEAGLIEATEREFDSYDDYVKYCLENGIQKTKKELEAIKESFIKEEGCCGKEKDKAECDSKKDNKEKEEDDKEED